jgi:hypothetical protein
MSGFTRLPLPRRPLEQTLTSRSQIWTKPSHPSAGWLSPRQTSMRVDQRGPNTFVRSNELELASALY